MKTIRVEYTVRTTGQNGKSVAVNKERILFEQGSSDPEHVQKFLEQEVQASEYPALGKLDVSSSLVVTNITELKPAGDDDQM